MATNALMNLFVDSWLKKQEIFDLPAPLYKPIN